MTGIGFWIQSYMVEPEVPVEKAAGETNDAIKTDTTNAGKTDQLKTDDPNPKTTNAETQIKDEVIVPEVKP